MWPDHHRDTGHAFPVAILRVPSGLAGTAPPVAPGNGAVEFVTESAPAMLARWTGRPSYVPVSPLPSANKMASATNPQPVAIYFPVLSGPLTVRNDHHFLPNSMTACPIYASRSACDRCRIGILIVPGNDLRRGLRKSNGCDVDPHNAAQLGIVEDHRVCAASAAWIKRSVNAANGTP